MSGLVGSAAQAAMTAMGRRWIDEVRPVAQAEDPGSSSAYLTDMRVVMKAFDTLFTAEMARLDINQVFSGLGIVIGEIWFQQDAETRAAISDALERGMTHGAKLAEKALTPVGRA